MCIYTHVLVAEISSMYVVAGEAAMYWRCGTELHIRTEVVPPTLAQVTHAAGHSRLNSHTVACKQREERGEGKEGVAERGEGEERGKVTVM